MQMWLQHERHPHCTWVNERPLLQQAIGICPLGNGRRGGLWTRLQNKCRFQQVPYRPHGAWLKD